MGYLERKALKRCQALIGPYAEPGEPVEDFDVGWFGGGKIDLISTDRTLWLLPSGGGELVKLPYADISSVVWQQATTGTWILLVFTKSGQDVGSRFALPEG